MSQLFELNISDYGLNYDLLSVTTLENSCFCCLSQNERMINVLNCKHTVFLRDNFKMDYSNLLVCHYCHGMLKKIALFKTQVEESCRILKHQLTQKPIKFANLQQSDTTVMTLSEEEPILKKELEENDSTNLKEETESTNDISPFDISTAIKVEHDISDGENDLPLAHFKEKKKREKTVDKNFQVVEGKVKIVILSEEELIQERERESKKESYLKLPFKCESCIKGFDHENTLKNHIAKQHPKDKKGIQCNICRSVLSTKSSFKEHIRRHVRRFECMVCGKRNNDVYSISQHYNQAHGDADNGIAMQFKCDDCDFSTNSNRVYRYHREKHKDKPQCSVCGNTFVSNSGLRIHMYTVHKTSTRQYKCNACDKSYAAKSGLAGHMARSHGAAEGAWCAPCQSHFTTKAALAHHLRTHSRHATDRRFTCNECGAKFLTKFAIQTHIDWEHLKSTKFTCNQCSKVFKTGGALKRHIAFVHEKKRPPRDKICDYCGRGFTTTRILVSHIRTHTGERPLQCPHCGATFAHCAALYTHKKLLHSKP